MRKKKTSSRISTAQANTFIVSPRQKDSYTVRKEISAPQQSEVTHSMLPTQGSADPDPGGDSSNSASSASISLPTSLQLPLLNEFAWLIIKFAFSIVLLAALIAGLMTGKILISVVSALMLLILVLPQVLPFLGPLAKLLDQVVKSRH